MIRLLLVLCSTLLMGLLSAADQVRPALWQATKGDDVVYLFGTIHVGRPDMYPFAPHVQDAIMASECIALEVDFGGNMMAVAQAEMAAAMYPKGKDCSADLDADSIALLQEHLAGIGLQYETMKGMKPWALTMQLVLSQAAKLGCKPELGIELQLLAHAKPLGKRWAGLEIPKVRYALLDEIDQNAFLRMSLTQIDEGAKMIADMIDIWKRGDMAALEKLAITDAIAADPAVKDMYALLLDKRNVQMVDNLIKLLKREDKVFVAVGAAHLIGPTSMNLLLEAKGFTVTRVK